MYDELVELVDRNGNIIAIKKRSEIVAQKLKNFRLVCAVLRDNADNFFILRLAATKDHFPNALACVGGCVQAGETYQQALKREVMEEIMLDIETVSYNFLGYVSPFEYEVNGYFAAYEIIVPSANIPYNTNDFSEMRSFSSKELKQITKEEATINLRKIIELFY